MKKHEIRIVDGHAFSLPAQPAVLRVIRPNVIEECSVHFITSMTDPLLLDARDAVHLPASASYAPTGTRTQDPRIKSPLL